MCRSINDWCLPVGLDSSFTCSLPHSCSVSMNTQPWTTWYQLLRGYVVFGVSKGWCITCLGLCMNHLSLSIPLSVCFFFIHWDEIQEWQISPDCGFASFLPCIAMHICFRLTVFNSIYAQPFIAIPRSTGIKSHFSAAEAVIPCCQSPLYCRSCICSSLVLSIEWELQEPRQAQLCCLTNQQNCISLHMNQCFLDAKGWDRLDKYVYLFGHGSQRFMLTISSRAPTDTYSCKYDEQVIYSQDWLSHSVVCVCLALVFICLGQSLCLQKVLNQNAALNRQTSLCLEKMSTDLLEE